VLYWRADAGEDAPAYFVIDLACWPGCEATSLPATANDLKHLRWSPTAPQLVAWGPENAIWLVDVETNTVTQVIGGHWNAFPAWSPDGSSIVFSSDLAPNGEILSDDIQIMPVDGSEADLVNLTFQPFFVEETMPRYSPDGRRIAYVTNSLMPVEQDAFSEISFGLFVIDAACIDNAPDACLESRRLLSAEDHVVDMVGGYEWSPDGQYIAYVDGGLFTGGYGSIWVVEVETGEVWAITDGVSDCCIVWGPDGETLLFWRSGEESQDVYIAWVDGREEPRILAPTLVASASPYWVPMY
jgi:Tol biopolymer transport system component